MPNTLAVLAHSLANNAKGRFFGWALGIHLGQDGDVSIVSIEFQNKISAYVDVLPQPVTELQKKGGSAITTKLSDSWNRR
jgi:hypothetical protein